MKDDDFMQHRRLRLQVSIASIVIISNRPCKVYQALDLLHDSKAVVAVTVSVPFYWPNSLVWSLFSTSQGQPKELA